MQKHFITGAWIGVAVLLCSSAASAQTAAGQKPIGNKTKASLPPICQGAGQYYCASGGAEDDSQSGGDSAGDFWGRAVARPSNKQKAASAPPHDISGTWNSVGIDEFGYRGGGQVFGAGAMPSDGDPKHEPPYSAEGLKAYHANKPEFGVTAVPAAKTNDPADACEPLGMPRQDLHRVSAVQIIQTPSQVIVLYPREKTWRVIWTDGRELPKDPDPSWDGYSTAKWGDSTTLVVQTIGTDERSWVDNAGRPHSSALRVEERFHRVDRDTLELTVTLDDPKLYTKPWVALDKLPFKLMGADFAMAEQRCSPSEMATYRSLVADPAAK